jgi:LCP family protein required for cell wall assembly
MGVAVVAASAGALLAVAIASTPLLQTRMSQEEAKIFNGGKPIATGKNFNLPQLTRPVHILVLGVKVLTTDLDAPPPGSEQLGYEALVNSLEGLSDTMLMVRFDPKGHKLVVLSLPRDTRTYVEGVGATKLNEANYVGGPALAAQATSELLGHVSVDRYIRINVQGIEKLVDALGGVTLYVPQDMQYEDNSQHLYINLKKGEQHLNGAQALQFLRFRYDNFGDIGRVQRQQMLMRALMEQALNPATIARLPQILSVIQTNLDTNLSVEELMALVGFAGQSDRPTVQMLMVPGRFSSAEEYEASYWLPDHRKLNEMVARYFGGSPGLNASSRTSLDPTYSGSDLPSDWTDETPEGLGTEGLGTEGLAADPESDPLHPANISVALQDSTGQEGVVQHFQTTLNNAGYEQVFVDSPWSQPLQGTRIIAQQGDTDAAEAIRMALGFGEVRVESTGDLESNITVQLGKDALKGQEFAPGNEPPGPTSDSPRPVLNQFVIPDAPTPSKMLNPFVANPSAIHSGSTQILGDRPSLLSPLVPNLSPLSITGDTNSFSLPPLPTSLPAIRSDFASILETPLLSAQDSAFPFPVGRRLIPAIPQTDSVDSSPTPSDISETSGDSGTIDSTTDSPVNPSDETLGDEY